MSTAYVSENQSEFERAVMLLDAYRASEMAHRRAADRARSREQRDALLRKAHERARFAREVHTELSAMGGPDPDDFRAADSHDSWPRMNEDLDSLVNSAETRVRSEVERTLAGGLPSDLQALIERHARALGNPSSVTRRI